MSSDENDSSAAGGDSLDQLLNEARWPATPQPTITRLAQRWQTTWAARLRREVLMRRAAAFAIAAGLLVAATIGWFNLRTQDKSIADVKRPPTPERATRPVERGPVVTETPQSLDTAHHEARRPATNNRIPSGNHARGDNPTTRLASDLAPSRAPNELEQLLLASIDSERKPRSTAKVAKRTPKRQPAAEVTAKVAQSRRKASATPNKPSAEASIVAAAVKRLVTDKKADAAQVAEGLRKSAMIYERSLLERLDRGPIPEQIAALRLLGCVGSSAAVGPVLRATEIPELHPAAIDTLGHLADPFLLSQLAWAERNVDLQRTLLAVLLARGEPVSLRQFLAFVENDRTAERALAAAQSVKNPPMDLLFAALSEPLEAGRIAAARVIGRIDGAATTQRLIAMVESGVNRHEACIALLSSRGPEAMRYVGTAADRDPTLAAVLSGARLFTSSDLPPRS
jgi:hypothetical protein